MDPTKKPKRTVEVGPGFCGIGMIPVALPEGGKLSLLLVSQTGQGKRLDNPGDRVQLISSRRLEDLADVDGKGLVGRLLQIPKEVVTNIAIMQRINVQSDDPVQVDMVAQLSD